MQMVFFFFVLKSNNLYCGSFEIRKHSEVAKKHPDWDGFYQNCRFCFHFAYMYGMIADGDRISVQQWLTLLFSPFPSLSTSLSVPLVRSFCSVRWWKNKMNRVRQHLRLYFLGSIFGNSATKILRKVFFLLCLRAACNVMDAYRPPRINDFIL